MVLRIMRVLEGGLWSIVGVRLGGLGSRVVELELFKKLVLKMGEEVDVNYAENRICILELELFKGLVLCPF
jgi:hypothetical protein